jgi:hypothetical protein
MNHDDGIHYHIRWNEKAKLDWACFATRAEAEKDARRLVLPGETYTIEEHGERCPQCARVSARGTSNEASA